MIEKSRSVPEMFLHRVRMTPDSRAFLYPDKSETWQTLTWKDTGDRVRAIACGLRALGLQDEERCAILSSTRIEWILADLGILCAGGATTTIYPAGSDDDAAYILQDSWTKVLFAENEVQLARVIGQRGSMPSLKKVVLFEGKTDGDFIISLEQLEQLGRDHDAKDRAAYEAIIGRITKERLATLIYTSGTTGRPKGVELTHDCWVYEGEAMNALDILSPDDLQYFWLPLAHVFGKVLEAGQIRVGFPTAVDGRVEKLIENLAIIKPTFICAVPRIFERVYNKVVGQVQEAGGLKYKIFKWAVGVGRRVSQELQNKRQPGGLLAIQNKIATKLVFGKLRDRFGGRVRFFISGSAPLSRELAEFFHACGLLVCEGYGLTESSAASFVNRPQAFKFGSVGLPMPGTEMKIAEDGEILLRSRGIMRGYRGLPEATAETLDKDGWLHTGDIGEQDSEGFLRITDRKKDLIKTSVGKYVAPQALEGRFRLESRYLGQIVIHGNNRPFCSALITVNSEEIKPWADQKGLGNLPYAELVKHTQVVTMMTELVEKVNDGLAKHEQIRKWALLPADLSVESGDLTPSLKVKRKHVETKYKPLLESFYVEKVEKL